ncbi:MAG: superoxide dismutase [Bacteroidota bacterium]
MAFELPLLPYASDALAPAISSETIGFHYGKHHQAYVNNLNNLVPGTPFEHSTLEQIILKAEGGIFNNGAQVWNHTFYFFGLSPSPKKAPEGDLAKMISRDFGSMEQFREAFNKAAATLFGSGWAWLVLNTSGKLEIKQTSNAGNPMRDGHRPLMTIDVWEHAYYLDYQNKRPDYIGRFWDVLDWSVVEKRL